MAECLLLKQGAGGGSSDDCTATAAEVLSPSCSGGTAVTSDSNDEPIAGTLTLNGDATAAYVLSGKTFYNTTKNKLTGTMTITCTVNT